MKFINKHKSPNFNKRTRRSQIQYIILHYTAMHNYGEAIKHLCAKKNRVSAHFLISKSGYIYNLVDIKERAWHAGESYWKGLRDLNSKSVGIEIDNSGHHNNFENYNNKQIKSLLKLLKFIIKSYDIKKNNILGHSDIAPYRKIDPGEKFPWKILMNKKLCFLPKKISSNFSKIIENKLKNKLGANKSKTQKSLYMLKKIGYEVNLKKINKIKYTKLIKCYQMHFRQNLVSGKIDDDTYEIIKSHFNQILT